MFKWMVAAIYLVTTYLLVADHDEFTVKAKLYDNLYSHPSNFARGV